MTSANLGLYFEDYEVGDLFEHGRGRTVTNYDNYAVTHLSLNTAQAHFDLEYSQQLLDGSFRERIVVGPCTIGIVIGLTAQDMSENALLDVGMTALRLKKPVFAGDTLHATSEVLSLEAAPGRDDLGLMRYRFTGTNQDGDVVAEGERTVQVKRRAQWQDRDAARLRQEAA
jgi:itaconyl-CoA hydratase